MNYNPNDITINYGTSYLSSPPNILGYNFYIDFSGNNIPEITIDQFGIIYINEKLYVGSYKIIIYCTFNNSLISSYYFITVKPTLFYNLNNIDSNSILIPILNPPLNNDIFSFDYTKNDLLLDISNGNIYCNNLFVNSYQFHVSRILNSIQTIYFIHFMIQPQINYIPNEKYIYFDDIDYSNLPIIKPINEPYIILCDAKIDSSGVLNLSNYDVGYHNIIVKVVINNLTSSTNYNLYVLPYINYDSYIAYSFTYFETGLPYVSQLGGNFSISGIFTDFNINKNTGIISVNAPTSIYNIPVYYSKSGVSNYCLVNFTINPFIYYNNITIKYTDISYNYPIVNEDISGSFSLLNNSEISINNFGIIELFNVYPNIYNIQVKYTKNLCSTITDFKLTVYPVLNIITETQIINYGTKFENVYFNIYPNVNDAIITTNSNIDIYNNYLDLNKITDVGEYNIIVTLTINNMTDSKLYSFSTQPTIIYPHAIYYNIFTYPFISDQPIINGNVNGGIFSLNLDISNNYIDSKTGIIYCNNLNVDNYTFTIYYKYLNFIVNTQLFLSNKPLLIYPNQNFYYNEYNFQNIIYLPINGQFYINESNIDNNGIIDLSGYNVGEYKFQITYKYNNIFNETDTIININKTLLNLSLIALSKEYDNNTNVNIICYEFKDITISGHYLDSNSGYNKNIIIDSIILPNYLDNNYYTSFNTISGNILKKIVYPIFKSYNKEFDNTLNATIDISNIDYSSYIANYVSKNSGIQNILISNIILNNSDNYQLSNDFYTISSFIYPKIVYATYNGIDKEYDGTTTCEIQLVSIIGIYEYLYIKIIDVQFISPNIGNQEIIINNYETYGKNANNYVVKFNKITANILQKKIILNIIAKDKVYDSTTIAYIYFNTTFNVLSFNANYNDKNVNIRKIIYVTDIILEDTNYIVDNCTLYGNIQPRLLDFNFIGQDKVFDGTTTCNGSYSINNLNDDDVYCLFDSEFKDLNSQENCEIKISNIILKGKDANNYKIGTINTNKPTIFKKKLETTFYSIDKMYDKTTLAFVKNNEIYGLLEEDTTNDTYIISLDANYDIFNIQNNLLITIKNIVLEPRLFNYYIVDTSCNGNIIKRELNLICDKPSKLYDGNTNIDIKINNILNIIQNDIVYIESFNSYFISPDAGNDVVVNITDIILNGESSDNYICNDFKISGIIEARYIVINFIAIDQEYEPDLIPKLIYTLDDPNLTIESYSAKYLDISVGTQKILITNIILGGLHKNNYIVEDQVIYGDIVPKKIEFNFVVNNKQYDGTNYANVICTNYNIQFDAFYNDINVGNKDIIINNIIFDISNYIINYNYTISGYISPSELFIYPHFEKYYDSSTNFILDVTISDIYILSYNCQSETANVGINKIFVSDIILDNNNYIINNFTTSGIIYPIIINPYFDIQDKIYDGNNNININKIISPINIVSFISYYDNINVGLNKVYINNIKLENNNYIANDITISSFIYPKLIENDFIVKPKIYDKDYNATIYSEYNIISYNATYENINVGIQNILVSNIIIDNNNYYINNCTISSIIEPRELVITFNNFNKYYDQNTNTNIEILSTNNLINDVVNIISYNSYYETSSVGNNIRIYINNIKIDNNNYFVNDYILFGNILPKQLECVFKNINGNIIGILNGILNNDDVYINNFISFNNNSSVQNVILGGKDKDKYYIESKIYNII